MLAPLTTCLAGTRALGLGLGGVLIPSPPAITLAMQLTLLKLTMTPDYCSTTLMTDGLTQRRAAALAALLQRASAPVLAAVPTALSLQSDAALLRGELGSTVHGDCSRQRFCCLCNDVCCCVFEASTPCCLLVSMPHSNQRAKAVEPFPCRRQRPHPQCVPLHIDVPAADRLRGRPGPPVGVQLAGSRPARAAVPASTLAPTPPLLGSMRRACQLTCSVLAVAQPGWRPAHLPGGGVVAAGGGLVRQQEACWACMTGGACMLCLLLTELCMLPPI